MATVNAKRVILAMVIAAAISVYGAVAATETASAKGWSGWQDARQASYYGGYGSASGIHAKYKLAVPISKVVSKKKWSKGSKKYKRSHFYYGEKVQLRVIKGKYVGNKRTYTIVDCGGFAGAGQMLGKGKHARWVPRWFDVHENGISHMIGTGEGVCVVTWRYRK